jgi:hypothetical protein
MLAVTHAILFWQRTADLGDRMGNLTLSVPLALGAEPTRDQPPREVTAWRDAHVVSGLALAVDITSVAVTAVLTSGQAFAEIALRLVHHVGAGTGDSIKASIPLKYTYGVKAVIETDDANGQARLAARVGAVSHDTSQSRQNGATRSRQ